MEIGARLMLENGDPDMRVPVPFQRLTYMSDLPSAGTFSITRIDTSEQHYRDEIVRANRPRSA